MKKIRVMIVEDSRTARELLAHLVAGDPRLEVAAAVGSGEEALRVLEAVSPDVISMDIRLPGMNGFEVTQRVMAQKPTPVVVVSSTVSCEELNVSLNALRAGALAVVEKPAGPGHREYEALAGRLCTQLAIMSQVRVVRQRIDRGLRFGTDGRLPNPPRSEVPDAPRLPFRVLGLVASTGGPNALTQLLGGLPADFGLPILLIQHITPCFLEGFVTWLEGLCPFRVRLAQDGDLPVPGTVYVPPADWHLRLAGGRLRLGRDEPVCLQRPSGTVLFQALARAVGPQALGVLLTGMGEDGAVGLKDLREAGGYTLAEDESTAVVYGMPAAAARLGGVCEALPLPEIAPRVVELVASRRH